MFTLSVFSYLNNTDLHALSAFEALTHSMNLSYVKRLKRYTHWKFTVDAPSVSEAKTIVETLLKTTYFVININKESFVLERLPAPESDDTTYRYEVSQKNPDSFPDTIASIHQKTGLPVVGLAKSIVWEIQVNAPQEKAKLETDLIFTSSVKQGLLCHPLYETAQQL